MRHSVRTNGLDGLAINKLDTLSGIGTLKMCVGYQKPDGTVLKDFPPALESLADCAPIYEEFEGFDEDLICWLRQYSEDTTALGNSASV